jgi:putative SOS response-associated peptidase YedK
METWSDASGSEIDSGCILTTSANQAIAKIHHRMPVVIKPQDFERWLDCRNHGPRDMVDLLQPVDNDTFEAIAVSDLVNKVANAGPEIQEPVSQSTETKAAAKTAKRSSKTISSDQMKLL